MKFEVKPKKQVRLGQVGIGSKRNLIIYASWKSKPSQSKEVKPIQSEKVKPSRKNQAKMILLGFRKNVPSKICPLYILVENVSVQNVSIKNVSVQNVSVKNVSVQNVSVKNMSVENVSADKMSVDKMSRCRYFGTWLLPHPPQTSWVKWPGYFLLQLPDCMMDTCMLLAGVREHWWPQ